MAAARRAVAAGRPGATVALIPLVVSASDRTWRAKAAKKNDRGGMMLGLRLNLVLAAMLSRFCAESRGATWNFNWKAGRVRLDRVGDHVAAHAWTPSRT